MVMHNWYPRRVVRRSCGGGMVKYLLLMPGRGITGLPGCSITRIPGYHISGQVLPFREPGDSISGGMYVMRCVSGVKMAVRVRVGVVDAVVVCMHVHVYAAVADRIC